MSFVYMFYKRPMLMNLIIWPIGFSLDSLVSQGKQVNHLGMLISFSFQTCCCLRSYHSG